MRVTFAVEGRPVPQPRPRAYRAGGSIRTYTPEAASSWKDLVRVMAKDAMNRARLLHGGIQPVTVDIRLMFERPASHVKKNGDIKPGAVKLPPGDADNYAKAIMDAMNGVCYADDTCVSDLWVSKRWGDASRVEVTVSTTPIEEL